MKMDVKLNLAEIESYIRNAVATSTKLNATKVTFSFQMKSDGDQRDPQHYAVLTGATVECEPWPSSGYRD